MSFQGRAAGAGRAVLALAGFYIAFSVVGFGLTVLQDVLVAESGSPSAGRGVIGGVVPGLAGIGIVYAVLVARTAWSPARLRLLTGGSVGRAFGRGWLWGVGLAGAALLLAVVGGARLLVGPTPGEGYVTVAAVVAVALALAALLEELLFRGFPLARLSEAVGRVGGSVVLAVGFAVAHLGNPDVSVLALVNIALASLLLSAVFFGPGGLPAAFGVHLGWNVGLVLGADAPVSGLRFGLPTLEYYSGSRDWLTGGRFGPEGGLVATIVLGGALWWWTRRLSNAKAVTV